MMKNGDKFRRLGLWERDPNLDSMIQYNSLLEGIFIINIIQVQ